jgi:hypothetical protein
MKNIFILIAIVVTAELISCQLHPQKITRCGIISKKHTEQDPTGHDGNFTMKHYFLMTDGLLISVSLKEYLKYEVGEKACIITDEFGESLNQ